MRVPRDLNIQRKSIKFIQSLSNILLSCSVFLVSPLSILDIKGDSNFRPESECQYEVSEDKKRENPFFLSQYTSTQQRSGTLSHQRILN